MLQSTVLSEQKFVYRTSRRRSRLTQGLAAGLAVAAVCMGAHPAAQFEKTISTTYDGWRQRPDGSYDMVFGYMNRNASAVEVPLGPANSLEPAPADQGQPTVFLPGRQRDVFHIHVPKDFKGKFVWTVSFAGNTQTATASLDQNYSLDVGDPEPPTVAGGPDMTTRLSQPVQLHPVVGTPAPAPEAPSANGAIVARTFRGGRITVWWSKFRGPGAVTFGGDAAAASEGGPTGREFPMGTFRVTCSVPLSKDCGATTARFSEPGTYWLRVVAAERSASNAIIKVRVDP